MIHVRNLLSVVHILGCVSPFKFQPPTDPVIVGDDKFEEREGAVVTIVSDCARSKK